MGLVSKNTSKGLLYFLSFIYFAAAITIIVFGIISFSGFTQTYELKDFKQDVKIGDNPIAKACTLLGGLAALVMAIFLFLSAKWRTGIFACPFGLLGLLGGSILITGFAFAVKTKDPTFYKDAVCNTKMAGLNFKTGTEVSKAMNDEFINKLMCSVDCPCEADHHDIIQDDIKEDTLAKVFKRTWKDKPSPGLIPMKFGFEDDDKIKREFASFEECYNEVLS